MGGDRERVDKSKKKTFITITAIIGVLLVFCLGTLVGFAVEQSNLLNYSDCCVALIHILVLSAPQFGFISAVRAQSERTVLLQLNQWLNSSKSEHYLLDKMIIYFHAYLKYICTESMFIVCMLARDLTYQVYFFVENEHEDILYIRNGNRNI